MIKNSGLIKKKDFSIISFFILLISFKSSNQWSTLPIGNELFWWVIQFFFIYLLYKNKNVWSSPIIEKNLLSIKLYLLWNIMNIIRGVFTAENYWEWKFLISTSFFLLLPLIVYLVNSYKITFILISTWFKYGLILFILIFPFLWGDAVGKYLVPITFLSLFFPILSLKWKFTVITVTVLVITFDLSARSNLIKFILPLSISLLYYFKGAVSIKVYKIARLILLFIPLVLMSLGMSGIFNVFKLDEYLGEYSTNTKSITGERVEENLTADTRTFLYIEVVESAMKNGYILFGRTPARGNDSDSFGDFNKETLGTGKQERFSNEVSILNIFTWLGLVGVILYFFVFIKATYFAINVSNNIFIKIIGLNVSFRWAYAFVEDFSNFDLSNIFLWIMIGMCFSPSFRKMTDIEMTNWIKSVLNNKSSKRFSVLEAKK